MTISPADVEKLTGLTEDDFAIRYRDTLIPTLQAAGRLAQGIKDLVTLANAGAAGSAAQAAASLASALALAGGAQGIGAGGLDVPRGIELGTGAFVDWDVATGVYPNLRNADYAVLAGDRHRLTYCTSGEYTWTLPLAADLPDGWFCRLKNRSGAILTVSRQGADTIDGGATTVIGTGGGRTVVRTSATSFESL
jgi:hypothetical protein